MILSEFKPHPGQALVLQSPRRFIGTISGVQGGKTTCGAVWLLSQLWKDYEASEICDYAIIAPTYKILQQSTMVKFRDMMPSDWGTLKENKQVIELKWGGRIFLRSADSPDGLEGMTLKAAWCDEGGQFKASVWTILQARVAITKGRILITSTPYACNWYWREIYQKAGFLNGKAQEGGSPDIEIISWGSTQNPAFSQEEFTRAQSSMSPELFQRRYCGVFAKLEGLVYEVPPESWVEPFVVPENWVRFGGMDFGKADPTVVIPIATDPQTNTHYVFDEFYKSNSLLKESVEFIKRTGLTRVSADPRGAQLIDELRRFHGCGMVSSADASDISVGIERVKVLLQEGRLKFFKRKCKNLEDEIESYHYAESNPDKVQKDAPVGKSDHAMDALRYAFSKQGAPVYAKITENALELGASKRKRYTPYFTRSQWLKGVNPITGY
jgi:PBSX family phage terminase large subunit